MKGYGLGLFYVGAMTEKHGGSVTVKSEPGKGRHVHSEISERIKEYPPFFPRKKLRFPLRGTRVSFKGNCRFPLMRTEFIPAETKFTLARNGNISPEYIQILHNNKNNEKDKDVMDKIKVLLVEDEETLAMIIKDTLEGQSFIIHTAADGEEGLRLFFDLRPDVLVADVMMPRMDGFEMVRRIRQTDGTRRYFSSLHALPSMTL